MPSCRLLPHGTYALVIATISTIAWCASLFQDGCDYAKIEGDVVAELATHENAEFLEFGIGAFREPDYVNGEWVTSYTGECYNYPEEMIDGAWKTSKAFAFLSLVLGGGGTLFVWCSTCFVFSRGTWKWAGYEILLASICQLISFCWFATTVCKENTCHLFWGSRASIVSCFLWLVAAFLTLCRYPLPKDESLAEAPQPPSTLTPSAADVQHDQEMVAPGAQMT